MKVCSKCKVEKPVEMFSRDSSRKDGLQCSCKDCYKLYNSKNKERIQNQRKEYYLRAREDILRYQEEYRKNNPEKLLARKRKYYLSNKERLLIEAAEYRENNKELIAKWQSAYYQNNKESLAIYNKNYRVKNSEILLRKRESYRARSTHIANASSAIKRARKLKATPSWLTLEDKSEIQDFYEASRIFRFYTGQEYHVDHIIPLQGKTVCGLHVPWNLQILPASENIRKHNKFEDTQ